MIASDFKFDTRVFNNSWLGAAPQPSEDERRHGFRLLQKELLQLGLSAPTMTVLREAVQDLPVYCENLSRTCNRTRGMGLQTEKKMLSPLVLT